MGFGIYQADNYDDLIDHPVEIGTHSEFDFKNPEISDYKSLIVEWGQKNKKELRFKTSMEGADTMLTFISNLFVDQNIISIGKGKTKKEAEQKAAEKALINIKNTG